MSEFKAIETQEQLDAIIGERLKRQAETFEKKYAGYYSPDDLVKQTEGLNAQIAELGKSLEAAKAQPEELNKQIVELQGKVKRYETDSVKNRITAELGLPHELASRLSGETEDDIRKDAEALKAIFGRNNVPPMFNPEPGKSGTQTNTDAAFKSMLQQLNN